jgi:hypothetical protein
MSRFNCKFTLIPMNGVSKPASTALSSTSHFIFDNGITHIEINRLTGLVDKYTVNGKNYIKPGALTLDIIRDNYDPWGMTVKDFRDKIGEFTLLSDKEGSVFSGHEDHVIPSVRVIESGSMVRAWADPTQPGSSRLTVETVYRPLADPSLPEREFDRQVPRDHPVATKVRSALQDLVKRYGGPPAPSPDRTVNPLQGDESQPGESDQSGADSVDTEPDSTYR